MKTLKLPKIKLPAVWYDAEKPGFCSKDRFRYSSYHVTEETRSLVEGLFPMDFFSQGKVGIMAQKIEHGFNGVVHKDTSRILSLNYMIDTGGNDAHLELYDEEKKLVGTFAQEVDTWCVLDTQQFHGVRNVVNPRLSITIQFWEISKQQQEWIDARV